MVYSRYAVRSIAFGDSLRELRKEGTHMEFNLVIFFIAIGLVIVAAVIAAVAAVVSAVAGFMQRNTDEEE